MWFKRKQNKHDLAIRYRTMSLEHDLALSRMPAKTEPAKKTVTFLQNDGKVQEKDIEANTPALPHLDTDAHLKPLPELLRSLGTNSERGLSTSDVSELEKKHGPNEIIPKAPAFFSAAALSRLAARIAGYLFGGINLLMWLAFIVVLLSYQPLGSLNGGTPQVFNLGVAMLLLLVILVSAAFYAIVEWRASRVMTAVTAIVSSTADVVRDNERVTIEATCLVPGDIVFLSLGQRVPADLRLIAVSADVAFDRALLTGEAEPVSGAIDATDENPLETQNLALCSTYVLQGSATGVVIATGPNTVIGRILLATSNATRLQPPSPIQRELRRFTIIVSVAAISCFVLSVVVWAAWINHAYPGYETASIAIINAIGCLTAFIPQGLPVSIALSLTIVAQRLARRRILVKALPSVETLGCVNVLCSDKTGTLTQGCMTVARLFVYNTFLQNSADVSLLPPVALSALYTVARYCNDATQSVDGFKGNPTDVGILQFALDVERTMAAPTTRTEGDRDTSSQSTSPHSYVPAPQCALLFRIPFNSKTKYMTTVVRSADNSQVLLLVKGAPDYLYPLCSTVIGFDGSETPLVGDVMTTVQGSQNVMASEGSRVIAMCMLNITDVVERGKIDFSASAADTARVVEGIIAQKRLTLVSLLGLSDPPRADVAESIQTLKDAHIRVFMVTGDFPTTACAIATHIGILTSPPCTLDDVRARGDLYDTYTSLPARLVKPDTGLAPESLVLTGTDVLALTPEDWRVVLGAFAEIVFARTTPEQKLLIVNELKAVGENTVAVTGDGVNDAPALSAAHIGIAMGAGSDVAKEAAAMVLLSNEFAAIVSAVEGGRLLFDNLRKVIMYLMPVGTYVEFVAVVANVFCGMQIPLSSFLQIVFCVTNDVVMSVMLMHEPAEADLMRRVPRNRVRDRLADWRLFAHLYLFYGLMTWPCAMGMFFYYMQLNGVGFGDLMLAYNLWGDGYLGLSLDDLNELLYHGQCVYYVTMVIMQFGNILAIRNRRASLFSSNPLRNKVIFFSFPATIVIAIVLLYGPGFQSVFDTRPIPWRFWLLPFAFALGVLLMDEVRKALVRAWPRGFVARVAW